MKKVLTMVLLAIAAMTASAQDIKLTFDFTQNPWNYPTTGIAEKGWNPDYDDETGFILEESKAFDWAVPGIDKKVVIIVTPKEYYDPEEDIRPPLLYHGPDTEKVGEPMTTLLWTNPGATVRFLAPEGYEFKKMMFWFYRNSYFVIDTEEDIEEERQGTMHKDKHFVWLPETPKVNKNDLECWKGTNADILFDYPFTKAVYEKIVMTLTPTGGSGITDVKTADDHQGQAVTLDGRRASTLHKGIYIVDGKKHVVK